MFTIGTLLLIFSSIVTASSMKRFRRNRLILADIYLLPAGLSLIFFSLVAMVAGF